MKNKTNFTLLIGLLLYTFLSAVMMTMNLLNYKTVALSLFGLLPLMYCSNRPKSTLYDCFTGSLINCTYILTSFYLIGNNVTDESMTMSNDLLVQMSYLFMMVIIETMFMVKVGIAIFHETKVIDKATNLMDIRQQSSKSLDNYISMSFATTLVQVITIMLWLRGVVKPINFIVAILTVIVVGLSYNVIYYSRKKKLYSFVDEMKENKYESNTETTNDRRASDVDWDIK